MRVSSAATGALLTGVFASTVWGSADGALFGNPGLVGTQAIGVLAAAAYSAVATFAILKLIALVTPLRRSAAQSWTASDPEPDDLELDPDEQAAVLQRLRALGYVE